MCFCDVGYTYDSDKDDCVDIDECATGSGWKILYEYWKHMYKIGYHMPND